MTVVVPAAATGSEFRRYWQMVVGAMIGVGFGSTGIIFFTLSLFVKPLAEEFGWSRAQASGSSICLQAGIILMSPLVGWLVDRYGPRRIGLLSMLGLGIGLCTLSTISGNILLFYTAFFAMSVLASGGTPVVWTRAINSRFDRQRGLALGVTLCGTGVVAFVAPSAVGQVIAQFGWRTAYLSMAAVIVLVALPAVAVLLRDLRFPDMPEALRLEPVEGSTLGQAMRTDWFWRNGVSFFLAAGALGAPIIHLAPMLLDAGLSIAEMGRIAGLLGIAMIFGRLSLGALVDRFNAPLVGMGFLLLSALGAELFITGHAAAGTLAIGFATGAEVDLLAYLVSRRFGLRHYGAIYGSQLSISLVGVGVASTLMGASQDYWGSYDVGLRVCLVVSLIGALGVGSLAWTNRRIGHPPLAA